MDAALNSRQTKPKKIHCTINAKYAKKGGHFKSKAGWSSKSGISRPKAVMLTPKHSSGTTHNREPEIKTLNEPVSGGSSPFPRVPASRPSGRAPVYRAARCCRLRPSACLRRTGRQPGNDTDRNMMWSRTCWTGAGRRNRAPFAGDGTGLTSCGLLRTNTHWIQCKIQ